MQVYTREGEGWGMCGAEGCKLNYRAFEDSSPGGRSRERHSLYACQQVDTIGFHFNSLP